MPRIIDLTHSLSGDIPSWDGDQGFNIAIATDYKDCTGPYLFRTQNITTRAGMGTHIDTPAHCFPNGKTIDQLALENLITDCVVIRIDDKADENYVAMPEVVENFEKEYGEIQPNTFVLFYTGWDKHWDTPERYRNDLKFPSVHESTAKLLLERDIAGLGIDTLSSDARGEAFPVHNVILGAGKYLVENIANAKEVPVIGAKVAILPMSIKGGTEAPVRMAALIS